jgi:predicted transglutaminase-like cysteine proteinase
MYIKSLVKMSADLAENIKSIDLEVFLKSPSLNFKQLVSEKLITNHQFSIDYAYKITSYLYVQLCEFDKNNEDWIAVAENTAKTLNQINIKFNTIPKSKYMENEFFYEDAKKLAFASVVVSRMPSQMNQEQFEHAYEQQNESANLEKSKLH